MTSPAMMTPDPKPEQRHEDFSVLGSLIREVATDLVKKLIWAMLVAVIALGGIQFRIWLSQRDIVHASEAVKAEISQMKIAIKEQQGIQAPYNQKTDIMWYQGEWYKRVKHEE
jgi:hypothetical protein